ncbi:FAD synthase-like isoform X1 [Limulus polyphemus]|uniref:FAD synthase n=1 Tax=Limulus polyphemus TaxID=6850 RepID=A0ABM1TAX7_LIMPO|nr:FAD synthase-like isoform X1 [Limulus polyphemus]
MVLRRSLLLLRPLGSKSYPIRQPKFRHSYCVLNSDVIQRFLCNVCIQKSEVTAGIIIIGDEILKGLTKDTNSVFLCQRLREVGVEVQRISVIRDEIEAIAEEVATHSQKYSFVITSGGIGPTHDDLTFEGVAAAFNEQVYPHPILVNLCKEYFGKNLSCHAPAMKLAHIPSSAKLNFGEDKKTGKQTKFPLVSVKNVYVFPGVPTLLEGAFDVFQYLFSNPNLRKHYREMYIKKDEVSITPVLNAAVSKFKGKVMIGSYPALGHSYYRVRLTLESMVEEDIIAAHDYLLNCLPEGAVVAYDRNAVEKAGERVYELIEEEPSVDGAVKVIESCLKKYKMSEICLSFNGGKDCTALLHLIHACLKRHYPNSEERLHAVYIRDRIPFPQVESFIQESVKRYNLDLLILDGQMRTELQYMVMERPNIRAMFMGTRRSDPGGDTMDYFCLTDPDWPRVVRVLPLLNWRYNEVWNFLRHLSVPYCSLYDHGFTSLGSMDCSRPNPALQYVDEKGVVKYHPAYVLTDCGQERTSRH